MRTCLFGAFRFVRAHQEAGDDTRPRLELEPTRVAAYLRVSTGLQTVGNQGREIARLHRRSRLDAREESAGEGALTQMRAGADYRAAGVNCELAALTFSRRYRFAAARRRSSIESSAAPTVRPRSVSRTASLPRLKTRTRRSPRSVECLWQTVDNEGKMFRWPGTGPGLKEGA